MRKHSDPYLARGGWFTFAACLCGWHRWYRCGPAGATIVWALHIAEEVTDRG